MSTLKSPTPQSPQSPQLPHCPGRAHPIDAAELNKTVYAVLRPADLALAINESHGLDTTPLFVRRLEADRSIQMVEMLMADGSPSKWGKMSLGQAVICYGMKPEMALTPGSDLIDQICMPVGEHLAAAVVTPGVNAARIFMVAVAEGNINGAGGWPELAQLLSQKRFTASTWFERDRKSVSLFDEVTQQEVFELWDDDVDQAIESGYLVVPKPSKCSDEDWVEPLLDYARSQSLLHGYEFNSLSFAVDTSQTGQGAHSSKHSSEPSCPPAPQ